MTKWHDNYKLVVAMAKHLINTTDIDTEELIYFLEKPWKWDYEFFEYAKENPELLKL